MASENIDKVKKDKGLNFFKKIQISVFKIEKYPEMIVEGFGKAISYISKLIVIIALIISIWTIYQTHEVINQGVEYLKNEFPEFLYSNGILNVDSEDAIFIENDEFGKIIIDTKVDSEEKINNYINSVNEYGVGALILKDRIILKNLTIHGEISYNYKEALEGANILEFNKQDVINYVAEGKINNLYIGLFVTLMLYGFSMNFINTLWYAVVISVIGYFTVLMLKMKMRYVAILNISIYALTLSTLLNILYLLINVFVNFNIEYFSVMYITIALIYLLAVIFIIKSELIKKQVELMKIMETEQIVKKEIKTEEEKKEEPNEKKDNDTDKKEKKEKEEKRRNNNEEPKESNA